MASYFKKNNVLILTDKTNKKIQEAKHPIIYETYSVKTYSATNLQRTYSSGIGTNSCAFNFV